MIDAIEYRESSPFRCEGGPWPGRLIALGDAPATIVFTLGEWRGRYVAANVRDRRCQWQDVPLQAAA